MKILRKLCCHLDDVIWCLMFLGVFGIVALGGLDTFNVATPFWVRLVLCMPILLGLIGMMLFAIGISSWAMKQNWD